MCWLVVERLAAGPETFTFRATSASAMVLSMRRRSTCIVSISAACASRAMQFRSCSARISWDSRSWAMPSTCAWCARCSGGQLLQGGPGAVQLFHGVGHKAQVNGEAPQAVPHLLEAPPRAGPAGWPLPSSAAFMCTVSRMFCICGLWKICRALRSGSLSRPSRIGFAISSLYTRSRTNRVETHSYVRGAMAAKVREGRYSLNSLIISWRRCRRYSSWHGGESASILRSACSLSTAAS
jgi:hypothetical protein